MCLLNKQIQLFTQGLVGNINTIQRGHAIDISSDKINKPRKRIIDLQRTHSKSAHIDHEILMNFVLKQIPIEQNIQLGSFLQFRSRIQRNDFAFIRYKSSQIRLPITSPASHYFPFLLCKLKRKLEC